LDLACRGFSTTGEANDKEDVMAELTPKYIDATNLKALAFLAFVGAGAYVVVGGVPVVAGSLVVALVLTVYHHAL